MKRTSIRLEGVAISAKGSSAQGPLEGLVVMMMMLMLMMIS